MALISAIASLEEKRRDKCLINIQTWNVHHTHFQQAINSNIIPTAVFIYYSPIALTWVPSFSFSYGFCKIKTTNTQLKKKYASGNHLILTQLLYFSVD